MNARGRGKAIGRVGLEVKECQSCYQRMSLREDNGVQARWIPGDQRIRRDQMMTVYDKDEEQEREHREAEVYPLAATHYCKWTT